MTTKTQEKIMNLRLWIDGVSNLTKQEMIMKYLKEQEEELKSHYKALMCVVECDVKPFFCDKCDWCKKVNEGVKS